MHLRLICSIVGTSTRNRWEVGLGLRWTMEEGVNGVVT